MIIRDFFELKDTDRAVSDLAECERSPHLRKLNAALGKRQR